ncbi:MAG: class I SAM-dependent methyltransferase [Candidatus Heimdallarchaeota archaeon]
MSYNFYPAPVYKFGSYIDYFAKEMEKKILDCGAGGKKPPLAMFNELGFETHGIEISDEQIKLAEEFIQKNNMQIDIIKGDIRELPYEDESFSFVYSYNTIFHLTKKDIKKAITEVRRVLRKDGLFFVNFMSMDDKYYGEGKKIGKGEFVLVNEEGQERYRTFFETQEVKDYFDSFDFLLLENRHIRMPTIWKDYEASYIDCIVKRK